MKRLRDILEVILLFLFIGLILMLAWFTIHGARKVKQIGEDLDRTIIIVAGAATNFEKASRQWEKSSTEQSASATKTFTNLNAAATSLNSLFSLTNSSLNSQLLPALSMAITDQNAALLKTQADLQANLGSIGQATAQTQQMIAHADALVSDPAIKTSIDSLAAASQNTADATKEAAGTMKDVHAAVDYEVHELTKPISKIKTVFLFCIKALGLFFGY